VVLIREGAEALGPAARPYLVGCTATISQVERLSEGRMNIGAVGRHRFRIYSLLEDEPYLIGRVELDPLVEEAPGVSAGPAERLRPWVEGYIQLLSQIGGLKADATQVPQDAEGLAWLAAAILQVAPAEKQELLAAEGLAGLLDRLRRLYREETAVLKAMAQRPAGDQAGFSLN
jgi:Lon protease-like protein